MKNFKYKYFTTLFILLLSISVQAQSFTFGWISDLHIGFTGADTELENIVKDINGRAEISFVIVTGDIAEKGANEELILAKSILDKLTVKYYIIPGNHDLKWSSNGGLKFRELWGSENFSVKSGNTTIVGINSGIVLKGGGGHISPETLKYLDKTLSGLDKSSPLILALHHSADSETDNWFELTNRLKDFKTKWILNGHFHTNKLLNYNGIPGAMGRTTLPGKAAGSKKAAPSGYTIAEVAQDSLSFTEVRTDSAMNYLGSLKQPVETVAKTDSVQFINYNAELIKMIELNESLISSPYSDGTRIFAATKVGNVYCFDLNGIQLWKYSTGGTILSTPAVYGNTVAIATAEGDLISLDASNGQVLETIGLGEPITSQPLIIDYTGTKYLMNGNKSEKALTVATASGSMFCYDLRTFEVLWQNSSAKKMVECYPLYIANKIIYGSWDGYLYCIDARSGVLIWKWSENKNFYYSPAACSPVSDGKYVFVATPDKYVSAIDLNLGKTIWHKNAAQPWQSLGISEDKTKLLVKSYSDKFFICAASSGKEIVSIDLKYGIDTMPNVPLDKSGYIFLALENGIIYTIDKMHNAKPVLFAGTARTHSVIAAEEGIFTASNMDGKLIIFKLKNTGN